ncbi:MAG: hypothetical protein Q7S58_18250 [Candidatus Binatus sp.]|uniref:hypothetical protein n=1 Tax=Candidatus Binatus sp. TaxID=2811406 RepID=UPI00271E9166|nr:hypothetical protein [Candidatus Binatus sp.]MDO8434347.1 hypothetical protein [Candidatus Binatus sp.]
MNLKGIVAAGALLLLLPVVALAQDDLSADIAESSRGCLLHHCPPPPPKMDGHYYGELVDRHFGKIPVEIIPAQGSPSGLKIFGSWTDNQGDDGPIKGLERPKGIGGTFGLKLFISGPEGLLKCRAVLNGAWSPIQAGSWVKNMAGVYSWKGCHQGDGGTFSATTDPNPE